MNTEIITFPLPISENDDDIKSNYLQLVAKLMRLYRRYRSLSAQNAREDRGSNARRYQESADDMKFVVSRAITCLNDTEIEDATEQSLQVRSVPQHIEEVLD